MTYPDEPHRAQQTGPLPATPVEVAKPTWAYALKRTLYEFRRDGCTDLAAGLTFFAVLSVFPALLAIVSTLGVIGQGKRSTQSLLHIAMKLGVPDNALDLLREPLHQLATSPGAGAALIVGLAGAVWSASGYVRGFGRAMNRIYRATEGRPFWKLYPFMLLVTVCVLAIAIIMMLILVVSGPIAERIGSLIGFSSLTIMVWNVAKWPVLVALVVLVITVLYYATPNVKQQRLRWFSIGAVFTIIVMGMATAGFGFYIANFGSYNATYGAIGGVIVLLLWLWIMNIVLLFGAEFNVETERARQLQAGIVAEDRIQLPARDTRGIEKAARQEDTMIDDGRELRRELAEPDTTAHDQLGD
ncbi:YihY/virulence factor BrkB family protein [Spelaeicoccus albus]|uniref:Membrane protein n=1 Tax=Spelaeicoccus albus TaxID=1280376 RepID=A0A7Z0IIC3_9MICO|nr:YihY/virulence factor BrkB family protein [Spelaeicoccus albus]NYI68388.1 membrane protein [Spelaeicoccus albus]